ncbi:hypothetical protein FSP39_011704 [Pinctada imbricata]|uniref:Uncharacterized protein n=1 Tax=Pinctada imbricata TaxID=66713 RepID=A0AA89BWX1_PINIB|nr:hypothetical protein FSP39_011704 [Pinctada imbricata]
MMPGLTFLGVGGLPVFVTNVQVSNLFGRSAASIVGALGGAYDSSPVVLLLAKIAFENGVGHKAFMIGLACCHSLLIINTVFFLPKSFIAKLDTPTVEFQVTKELENDTKERLPSTKESKQSLRGCIFSPIYIIHVSWICILQLRFYYLLGTLNPFLHKITNTNEALVSHFTDVIGYCMLGGLVTTTFAGVVYDWQKHLFKDKQTDTARKLLPTVLPLCTASGLSLLMSILLLIPSVKVLYPSEYFAMLYGIMIVAGGLTSALQYALYSWAQAYDNGYFHVSMCVDGLRLGSTASFEVNTFVSRCHKTRRTHVYGQMQD